MSKNTKCKECGSGQTYVRLETQERVCRSCGAIKPLKSKEKPLENGSTGTTETQEVA